MKKKWGGAFKTYEAETFLENVQENVVIVAGFNVLLHKELTEKLIATSCIKKVYVLDGDQVLWANSFRFLNPKIFLIDNYYEGLIKRDLNYEYFMNNYALFAQTYDWLEDEKSKKTMEDYLRGHIELTNFPMMEVWETADVKKQYFPEDIIHLSDQEVFVDCGAYTGDTLDSFLKRTGNFKKYYALEPDRRLFKELKQKVTDNKIIHFPVGAWDRKDSLKLDIENGCGTIQSTKTDNVCDENRVDVDKIDNLVSEKDKVTFIKMDIEGAELKALYGAENIIKRDKPTLAVCVYHKREDLITLPQYIKSLEKNYKLYLRAHFAYASEVVLYAIYQQGQ